MKKLLIALLLSGNIAGAHAQEDLTLPDALTRVLVDNPLLKTQPLQTRMADARLQQAQLTAPYGVKLELENFAGSGDYAGVDRLETTLSVTHLLEMGGKTRARSDLAQQQTDLLTQQQRSERLDVLAEAAERFVHVLIDQQRFTIAEQRLQLAEEIRQVVQRRVKAGRSHIAEERRANIELTRAEIEMEHAEHELATSRLKLASSWGAREASFGIAKADLFTLPQILSLDELQQRLQQNPDLLQYASEERIAQARLRLAEAQRSTDVELAAGFRSIEANDAAFVLSASLPLGASKRARHQVAEMQSLSEQQPLHAQQHQLELYVQLYETYQELLHARTALDAMQTRIIPEAEQAAADYQQAYQSGRFSLLELNEAQNTLLEARLQAVTHAGNYHRLRIEIERLTGADLHPGVTQ